MGDAFEQRLEESRNTPLYGGLTKYQHIERLGHEDVEGLLDDDVFVQEKLDGANATVAYVYNPVSLVDELVIATRNQTISINGNPRTGFKGLVEYVLNNPGFQISGASGWIGWILRGEWLVKHSLNYDADAFKKFYVFDVQDQSGSYIHPDTYIPVLTDAGIATVPTLARVSRPSVDVLTPYSQGLSFLGGADREGIVVKRYDFVNKWGRTTWGKIVTADFKEKNKLSFGAAKHDPVELRFVSDRLTETLVMKNVHKTADEKSESPRVQHMGAVIGRTWHDLLREELPDWLITTKKQPVFDFQAARKLSDVRTRDVALAYYNGVPSVHTVMETA